MTLLENRILVLVSCDTMLKMIRTNPKTVPSRANWISVWTGGNTRKQEAIHLPLILKGCVFYNQPHLSVPIYECKLV